MTDVAIKTSSSDGDLLREIVDGLGAAYGVERSTKLAAGEVLDERFLLTLHKNALGADPLARLLYIGNRFHLPEAFADSIADGLPEANIIHLGFEGGGKGAVCKIYLEFAEDFPARREAAAKAGETMLLYRAFKWNLAHPGNNAVTRYLYPPCRTEVEIRDGIAASGGAGPAAELASTLLAQALRRVSADDLMFMRIEEAGTPRRSFDLNVYKADITGADIVPHLAPLWRPLGISDNQAANVESAIRGEEIGHISGGVGRDGIDFLTLYFGMKEGG